METTKKSCECVAGKEQCKESYTIRVRFRIAFLYFFLICVYYFKISTWTEIFLFDLPTLLQDASSETGQLFTTMFESLWSDETIIKIGKKNF